MKRWPAAPHCPTCGCSAFVVATAYGWRATCCTFRWSILRGEQEAQDSKWTQEIR